MSEWWLLFLAAIWGLIALDRRMWASWRELRRKHHTRWWHRRSKDG